MWNSCPEDLSLVTVTYCIEQSNMFDALHFFTVLYNVGLLGIHLKLSWMLWLVYKVVCCPGNPLLPQTEMKQYNLWSGILVAACGQMSHLIKFIWRINRFKSLIMNKAFITRHVPVLKKAFLTCVRTVLEYASNVWAPYLIKHINTLEKVHKHFTKRIPLSLICPTLSA